MIYNESEKGVDIMAQVNFRVDDTIKARAEKVCSSMGLNMSTAINIFLTKLANEQRIPFEVSVDPFYSDEHISMLEKRVADMKAGRNTCERELIKVD